MKKVAISFILGGIIFGSIGVYAVSEILAKDVKYKDNKSVETALNDLYDKVDVDNAPSPELKDGLIPVTIKDDGTVIYADTSKEWYNYSKKIWANAVILIDSPSKEYKVNEQISETDIESYFVWIPRYRYRLWNTGTASKTKHEIEIKFENNKQATSDSVNGECKTPMTSGETGNCVNGDWMTHPAFISLDVNGIWVGKFETGYKGATTTATAQVNSNDSTKIIVKPNVYSWRNNTVYNFFMSSYNYKRDLGSHMMKNTEWGAVAYLSHSKYGINREVNINNNDLNKTGYSALPSTNQQTFPGTYGNGPTFNNAYNTEIGYLASTTGNISGVYDMSGGTWEYVAAYRAGTLGSSGFNTTTIATSEYQKYIEVYSASSTVDSYQYRVLGDATGEIGPFKNYLDTDNYTRNHSSWYSASSSFVGASYPWFSRGGGCNFGSIASQFTFDWLTGGVYTYIGSRLALAPQ